MQLDIRNVRTRWINMEKDVDKAAMMQGLLDGLGFTDHERFEAVVGIKPHRGVRKGEEHYRSCAESHFRVLKETIFRDGKPVLVLEDDIDVEKPFAPEFFVPDEADAVYLGTSHGGFKYKAVGYKHGLVRIMGVLATHAILYLNKDYAKAVKKLGRHYIYRKHLPFDVALAAELQAANRVCARHQRRTGNALRLEECKEQVGGHYPSSADYHGPGTCLIPAMNY